MTDHSLPHLHLAAQETQAYMDRLRRSGILHTLETTLAQHAQHMETLRTSGVLDAMEATAARAAQHMDVVRPMLTSQRASSSRQPLQGSTPLAREELDAHQPSLSIVPKAGVADAGPGTHVAYAAASWTKPCGNPDCDKLIPDRRRYCDQCRDEADKETKRVSSHLHYHDTHPNSQANREARAKGFRNERDRMTREGRAHRRRA